MISIINLIIIAIMTLQSFPSCNRETKRNNNVYLDFPQNGLSFTLSTDTLTGYLCTQFHFWPESFNNPLSHTHILPWGTRFCWMGCIGLFPLSCSFSLGDFNNLELNEDVLRTPPLEERLLPLPPPPLLLDREGKKENTEVGGTAKEGLLDELCLLSEKENKGGAGGGDTVSGKSSMEPWRSPLKSTHLGSKNVSLSENILNSPAFRKMAYLGPTDLFWILGTGPSA